MKTEDLKIIIADIETYRELFICGGYIPHEDRWVMWEISKRKNQMDAMIKFILEYPLDYWCFFNGVGFDSQVLQYIIDKHPTWYDKTWSEIVELVYIFVQELISGQNYEQPPPYKEQHMDIKQIDLFLILHMNNENRMTSLKWCMYGMDEDIELMEVDHAKTDLTDEEIEQTIYYWRNDIKATCTLYKYCVGDCDHELYKDKNKIQMRLDLIEEMKLPSIAINWNDVKIGTELNKKRYMELAGINHNQLWTKVKNRKTRTHFTFGDCYPNYWKFESEAYQQFFSKVAKTVINLNEKQEFPFKNYMMARGGAHSCEGPRVVKPTNNQILKDADIGSDYPWAIAKRKLSPGHLGHKWNEGYVESIPLRMNAKKKFKETKEKKYESLAEAYKYVLNGNFGKLIDRRDFQYDAFVGMQVTIGCQVDIFMLVEDIELAGMEVISLNTDGLVVLMDKTQEAEYYRICEAWEKQVGNDTGGRLEYSDYELLVQTSVNDYIAVKAGDEPLKDRVKKKGEFLTEYELHKNKSKSIVPVALEQYYVNNIPVEQTITQCRDIYLFGIAKKASKDYSYIGTNGQGKTSRYKKLIRYYAATKDATGAEKLWKVKNEGSDKTGPARSNCEGDSKWQIVFNKKPDTSNWEAMGVDYSYYIRCAKKLMHRIDGELQRSDKIQVSKQIQMFN